jgi:PAS domain S-box-containing protein
MEELPIRIFLVDDDEVDCMAFERALRKAEVRFNLETCHNAESAFNMLTEVGRIYDLIFIDYQLPGQDGLSLLKSIRMINTETPVVVITSQGDEKLAVEMMKAGAFDYFPKSEVTPSKLIQVLSAGNNLLQIRKEKARVEEELIAQQKLVAMITEASPSLISVIELESRKVIYSNRPVCSHLGYPASMRDPQTPFFDERLLHPDDKQKLEQSDLLLADLNPGEVVTTEYRLKHYDGSWRWFENRETPFVRDSISQVRLILRTMEDITVRKNNELELLESKQKVENTLVARALMLSNVSHEIRTPMNAILGLTELLLNDAHNPTEVDNLNSIKQSAENLLIIINDILDFAKIEAGKITFESIDFSLSEVINHLKKTMQFKFVEKGLSFTVDIDPQIPDVVKGDPYRLNQIVMNLIGNALKFTHKGGVDLCAGLVELTDEECSVIFLVKDTGIGISEDKLKTIFDQFEQGGSEVSRLYGGTGLGLAITKQLVEQQNGAMSVSSKVGEGSVFEFKIVFGRSKVASISKDTIHEGFVMDLQGRNILVVEDNVINQKVMLQTLERLNAKVTIASNGLEALERIRNERFDLIFMDLQMPEMDGYEATKMIRNCTVGSVDRSIPIIALTADAFAETRQKALSSGFTDYLPKPFKRQDLIQRLNKYLI